MSIRFSFLLVAALLYCTLIPYYSAYLTKRPVLERVGYVPPAEIISFSVADQRTFVSSALVVKVLTYFGGISQLAADTQKSAIRPEYREMYRMLDASIKLDPYNMDTYYFSQAILAWDTGQIAMINKMLEYGMQHRNWDWYLPFFLGFNHAYFMKDYKKASGYYQKAGELSGSDLFMRLAGRYLYDVGQTEQAVLYLTAMLKTAKNEAVKQNLGLRLKALQAVLVIEKACNAYAQNHGTVVPTVEVLHNQGFLKTVPQDPYGGTFFISNGCKVASSSGFYAKSVDKK